MRGSDLAYPAALGLLETNTMEAHQTSIVEGGPPPPGTWNRPQLDVLLTNKKNILPFC